MEVQTLRRSPGCASTTAFTSDSGTVKPIFLNTCTRRCARNGGSEELRTTSPNFAASLHQKATPTSSL